ncbi:hypothetical protein CLAIMM_05187 [Cladophialophora immunda]|nr:hypothetical protein CLAIMM_05187 [Cladophialophora immunda]
MLEAGELTPYGGIMTTNIQIESEAWCNVQDKNQRKRIEDRLAQRARRKRVANSGCGAGGQESSSADVQRGDRIVLHGPTASIDQEGTFIVDQTSNHTCPPSLATSSSSPPLSGPSPPGAETDPDHLSNRVSSVLAALFDNGMALGLRCGIQIPILLPPCTEQVPLSLHPTELQMKVLHVPWIDRFPFPTMRDTPFASAVKASMRRSSLLISSPRRAS